MNLPALGIEFLDVFVDGCMSDWPENIDLPFVHTYCFSKSSTPQKDVAERVEKVLGYNPIQNYKEDVRIVRDVAPNKLMLCAEFQLLREGDLGGVVVDVNGNNNDDDGSDNDNNNKRKMDDDKYNNNNVNNNKKMKK